MFCGNEKVLVDSDLSSFSIRVLSLLLKTRIQGMVIWIAPCPLDAVVPCFRNKFVSCMKSLKALENPVHLRRERDAQANTVMLYKVKGCFKPAEISLLVTCLIAHLSSVPFCSFSCCPHSIFPREKRNFNWSLSPFFCLINCKLSCIYGWVPEQCLKLKALV